MQQGLGGFVFRNLYLSYAFPHRCLFTLTLIFPFCSNMTQYGCSPILDIFYLFIGNFGSTNSCTRIELVGMFLFDLSLPGSGIYPDKLNNDQVAGAIVILNVAMLSVMQLTLIQSSFVSIHIQVWTFNSFLQGNISYCHP